MKKTARVIYIILLCAALLVTVPEFIRTLVYVGGHIKYYLYFLGGGAIYAVIVVISKTCGKLPVGRYLNNVLDLEHRQARHHEDIHEIAIHFMLHPVESYNASRRGGEVSYRGNRNMFISLSPYCFPFFPYFFLLIQLMVSPKYPYYALLPGFLFFFFLHAVYMQLRPHQKDLTHYGYLASYLFIANFLMINTSIILYAVKMNIWKGLLFYFEDIWGLIRSVLSF